MTSTTRTHLFFTAGVNGSRLCWRKLVNARSFYRADVVLSRGNILGPGIQAIISEGRDSYRTIIEGQALRAHGQAELEQLYVHVRNLGLYPLTTSTEELELLRKSPQHLTEVYGDLARQELGEMLAWAEQRLAPGEELLLAPGDDDLPFVDEMLRQSSAVRSVEGMRIALDKRHEMICSSRLSAPAPTRIRQNKESDLEDELETLLLETMNVYNSVFSMNVPPYDSGLDLVTALDSDRANAQRLSSMGSRAVRWAIERHQPAVSLHGAPPGGFTRHGASQIGRTLCLCPGSQAKRGILHGFLIVLGNTDEPAWQSVQG